MKTNKKDGDDLMIKKATAIIPGEKKIRMIIAGPPGIGKTTLAMSAPRPLHIDTDYGIDRIEPNHRADYIQPQSYQEIMDDLNPENLIDYDTLVIDTGGKLLTLIGQHLIKKEPKYGQRDGSLSLKGFGALAREFSRFMDYCFYELKKNIIVVFHTVEEKDGDSTKLRIKAEGSTKNSVWECMDLGGFLEMQGDRRTIGFSNCERYYAKGTRGIKGLRAIPELTPDKPNDFLTRLFAEYNERAAEEARAAEEQTAAYNAVMEQGRSLIASVRDADTANINAQAFKKLPHALTSKKELGAAWNKRMKELGLIFDKASGAYVCHVPDPVEVNANA